MISRHLTLDSPTLASPLPHRSILAGLTQPCNLVPIKPFDQAHPRKDRDTALTELLRFLQVGNGRAGGWDGEWGGEGCAEGMEMEMGDVAYGQCLDLGSLGEAMFTWPSQMVRVPLLALTATSLMSQTTTQDRVLPAADVREAIGRCWNKITRRPRKRPLGQQQQSPVSSSILFPQAEQQQEQQQCPQIQGQLKQLVVPFECGCSCHVQAAAACTQPPSGAATAAWAGSSAAAADASATTDAACAAQVPGTPNGMDQALQQQRQRVASAGTDTASAGAGLVGPARPRGLCPAAAMGCGCSVPPEEYVLMAHAHQDAMRSGLLSDDEDDESEERLQQLRLLEDEDLIVSYYDGSISFTSSNSACGMGLPMLPVGKAGSGGFGSGPQCGCCKAAGMAAAWAGAGSVPTACVVVAGDEALQYQGINSTCVATAGHGLSGLDLLIKAPKGMRRASRGRTYLLDLCSEDEQEGSQNNSGANNNSGASCMASSQQQQQAAAGLGSRSISAGGVAARPLPPAPVHPAGGLFQGCAAAPAAAGTPTGTMAGGTAAVDVHWLAGRTAAFVESAATAGAVTPGGPQAGAALGSAQQQATDSSLLGSLVGEGDDNCSVPSACTTPIPCTGPGLALVNWESEEGLGRANSEPNTSPLTPSSVGSQTPRTGHTLLGNKKASPLMVAAATAAAASAAGAGAHGGPKNRLLSALAHPCSAASSNRPSLLHAVEQELSSKEGRAHSGPALTAPAAAAVAAAGGGVEGGAAGLAEVHHHVERTVKGKHNRVSIWQQLKGATETGARQMAGAVSHGLAQGMQGVSGFVHQAGLTLMRVGSGGNLLTTAASEVK